MTNFPYDRIVSYGCSVTAGSEMTDHDAIGITEDELAAIARKNKYVGSHQIYQHFSIDKNKRNEILIRNRTKSWPNFIAKHYGIPLLNQAINGSSLQHATYFLQRDIHSDVIKSSDLIVVGVTSPNRWFQFTSRGFPFYGVFGSGWETLDHSGNSLSYIHELEKHWYNLYNVLYSYCKEIQYLSNLSDTMNGQIKLCYAIGTPTFIEHIFSEELKSGGKESDFLKFCNKLIDHKHFLYPEKALPELAGFRDYSKHHTFGHPRVQYHEQFANVLISELEKMYND